MNQWISRRGTWAVLSGLVCLAGCQDSPPRRDIDFGPQALRPWRAVRGVEHYGRGEIGLVLAGDAEICLPFGVVGAQVARLADGPAIELAGTMGRADIGADDPLQVVAHVGRRLHLLVHNGIQQR